MNKTKRKHLIIGCGSAGLTALEKIRSLTWEDEIKVITMENYLPYSPTSLPFLLSKRIKENDIWTRTEEYFHRLKTIWVKGKEVTQLLPREKQVIYHDGTTDDYDTLLIASGSDSVKPAIKGLEEAGFLDFHTLKDYYKLRSALTDKKEVTILGAGLVGMELAMALCEAGYQVQVIEREMQILPLYFHETAAVYIKDIFLNQGVKVFTGKEVAEVRKRGEKVEVSCADGDVFIADLLLTCVGVKPRTTFLTESGIIINTGVLVNSKMMSNIDGIYAAGDVAETSDFFSGQPGINGIIPNAVAQGKVAGANMAGEETKFDGWISMNVFNFFGNMSCSIGLSMAQGDDKQVLEKRGESKNYLKRLVFQNDKLVGAMFLNEEVDPGVIRYIIESRIDLGKHKELLFQKTKEVSHWLMLEAERRQAVFLGA